MLYKIKTRIKKELKDFVKYIDKTHSLRKTSPLLYKSIKNFMLRKGKRFRPILFVIGYLGFSKKKVRNLYRTALSIELLHDFMIIHDDIIDKSDKRRGKFSLHKEFDAHFSRYRHIKFSGSDLSIITGDVMYALACYAFLSISEKGIRKEAALKYFIESGIYSGLGQFSELLYGIKGIEKTKAEDIYKIYDLKTAYYSFAAPLVTGAILAGAKKKDIDLLFDFGINIGRAFQIKDDILGIFGKEKETGKPSIADLKEGRKTILIWYTYKNTGKKNKLYIKNTLLKENIYKSDFLKIQNIIIETGSLLYVKKEIVSLFKEAEKIHAKLKMFRKYKDLLLNYSRNLLTVN